MLADLVADLARWAWQSNPRSTWRRLTNGVSPIWPILWPISVGNWRVLWTAEACLTSAVAGSFSLSRSAHAITACLGVTGPNMPEDVA